jgi:hypothetical protein
VGGDEQGDGMSFRVVVLQRTTFKRRPAFFPALGPHYYRYYLVIVVISRYCVLTDRLVGCILDA